MELEFKFKGSRDYIQGPDMINALMELTGANSLNIDIKFYKRTNKFLEIVNEDHAAKVASFRINDGPIQYLKETASAVTDSYPYPEDEIISGSKIADNEILFFDNQSYSDIEIIVALTKKLHTHYFDTKDKWLFARGVLNIAQKNKGAKRIKIIKNIGSKLTQSSVYVNDDEIGHIYFSAVSK